MIVYFKKKLKLFLNRYKFVRGNINYNDRKGALHKAWGYVFSNYSMGDYVEFGVCKGDSFINSIKSYNEFNLWFKTQLNSKEKWRVELAKKSELNSNPIFHGLDTFDGMPDNDEGEIFKKGNFYSKIDDVQNKLEAFNKIDYKLYKGKFEETSESLKKNLENRKIAIVNFDCDIEKSTRSALNIINDHLSVGSILMFDDYNHFNANNNLGQRKAFDDFKKNSNFVYEKFFTYEYVGQSFLVVDVKK
tara:strand:- start:265 stop:1002 length:738 start_codon:yes stop_codon:yes gene_type:complete